MEQIKHEGIVSAIHGNTAEIKILQISACAGCHASAMCMAAESREKVVEVELRHITGAGREGITVGDRVEVSGAQSLGMSAAMLAYVVPFVVMMVVLCVALLFGMTEVWAGVLAIAALVPYYIILYMFRNRLSRKFVFTASKIDK